MKKREIFQTVKLPQRGLNDKHQSLLKQESIASFMIKASPPDVSYQF